MQRWRILIIIDPLTQEFKGEKIGEIRVGHFWGEKTREKESFREAQNAIQSLHALLATKDHIE